MMEEPDNTPRFKLETPKDNTPQPYKSVRKSVESRFWPKVEKTDGCWFWTRATDTNGYGVFGVGGMQRSAHRVAYELLVGPITDGLEIDHLCLVKNCVNPDHMEIVTHLENMRRMHLTKALRHDRINT
jgi:hypothetical protein